MKRHSIVRELMAFLCACALVSVSAFSPPEGFVPLFNGRNLEGWEVASPGAGWKVNDQILENHSGHSALISTKKYHNYILIFDWRTPKDDPHENGLLIYIDRGTYTSGQKEPVRTGFFVPGPSIAPNLVGRWNRTRITVEGDRCTIEVNDRVVATSDKLAGGPQPGKFAIGRDGARLDLANIYIKELK